MNFSGNRYSRKQLQDFVNNTGFDTYVIDCTDRFGAYGTVGFCVIDLSDTRLIDLMFSCRIQGKRIEHAFVSHIICKYADRGPQFYANYRKSKKNAGPGKVFDDLGFEFIEEVDGVHRLAISHDRQVTDEGLVTIEDLISCSARLEASLVEDSLCLKPNLI